MDLSGLILANRGPSDNNDGASALRVGLIPQQCGLFYFETIIVDAGNNG
ncbi:2845_t:CDS:2 [Cetraspora pellucida]|uniref:2845_t:CDS:1 n=1 Tax=Cetraspora pellucida TaxID=1433469 RepID=A0A9N9G7W6_9GLOM|nr:2845_t:CDS:2 [Cetraspora pellucida]